jgi:hypothetical protein
MKHRISGDASGIPEFHAICRKKILAFQRVKARRSLGFRSLAQARRPEQVRRDDNLLVRRLE